MGHATRTQTPLMVHLKAFIKDADKIESRIGWFDSSRYPDNNATPVAYVAAISEFGAPSRGIPARPFMRPTITQQSGIWSQQAGMAAKRVTQGSLTTQQAFEIIAMQARGDVDKTLRTLWNPPLSQVTMFLRKYKAEGGKVESYATVKWAREQLAELARKGEQPDFAGISSKPLNDTGYMIATLNYTVVMK